MCLLLLAACKHSSTMPTGDLQYYQLKGNVSSLDSVSLYPDNTISFDADGFIILPGTVSYEDEIPHLSSDYTGPFKIISWPPKSNEVDDSFFGKLGVSLTYDSLNKLVKVSAGIGSNYLYYDEKGRLYSILHCDEEGGYVTDITYDKDGNRIMEHTYEVDAIIKDIVIDHTGDKAYISLLKYFGEDTTNLKEIRHEVDFYDRFKPSGNGEYVEYDHYIFDKNKNWISRRVVRKDGAGKIINETEDDRDGLIKYY